MVQPEMTRSGIISFWILTAPLQLNTRGFPDFNQADSIMRTSVGKQIKTGASLRSRISGGPDFYQFSWFQNRSSNQLVGIPLPGTTGFSSIQANLDAEVQNRE